MLNVALLSRWHVHADDYAREVAQSNEIQVSAVWDEEVERGKEWAEELSVPFYSDLADLLAEDEIDGVIVCTPTTMHKEVMTQVAQAGKHIFTEKVVAITVEEYNQILEVIHENDVKFMVSLPRLTENPYLQAQSLLDQGEIGELTTIRCRFAHNGAVPTGDGEYGWLPEHFFDEEVTGGGALIDLGAHPIYLTNRLAGPAVSISANLRSSNEAYTVDDNAVVLVEYQSGALGILETSFVSDGSPFQLELYGTKGTILIQDESVRLQKAGQWKDITDKISNPMPMKQWIQLINGTAEPTLTEDDFYRLTLVNELAAKSNKSGVRVQVED